MSRPKIPKKVPKLRYSRRNVGAGVQYEQTICSRDAFQRGSGQKALAFSFYSVPSRAEKSARYLKGVKANLDLLGKLYTSDWHETLPRPRTRRSPDGGGLQPGLQQHQHRPLHPEEPPAPASLQSGRHVPDELEVLSLLGLSSCRDGLAWPGQQVGRMSILMEILKLCYSN